jgi:pimeloyl-ACP methyl ester carboxylesterase
VHLYEWGDPAGRPLLYWDGLGGSGLHANEIGPILAEVYGFHVLAPDPPGHGRSLALPPAEYRPSRLAALAAELVAERTVFVGFSVGAEVGVAFAARHPEKTRALVLVDGGHWDFADVPGFDTSRPPPPHAESYPSWAAYFAEQAAELGRWTPALEEAHRATMRERGGAVVPILSPDDDTAIAYGSCLEPTTASHQALRESRIPVLLILPDTHRWDEQVGRFRNNVPQLEVRRIATDVHDLVSHAPDRLARLIGDYTATCPR